MDALTLYELNNLVRTTLSLTLESAYWVTAEVSSLQLHGGHCYLELVEKDERRGGLKAKARAVVWRDVYTLLAPHFSEVAGRELGPGLQIRVRVSVQFHELYGYSLIITDIDPVYTLGDMARRRQEILRRLEEEGVIDLNRQLPLPRLMQRVAIISSATAAGYGDFCKQLEQSGLCFTPGLFPATMQGDQVEPTVCAALERIFAEADRWDVVVIIRGGGATSDLSGFDTYLLAAAVAQFPLPVLTGIGHERDETVIDRVAHTRLKTPTAVAAFLVEHQQAELRAVVKLEEQLRRDVMAGLDGEQRQLQARIRLLQALMGQYAGRGVLQLERMVERYVAAARQQLTAARTDLEQRQAHLAATLPQRLERQQDWLAHVERTLRMAGPERILQMGYTLTTTPEGRVVTSAAALRPGQTLITHFNDGTAESRINLIHHHETK